MHSRRMCFVLIFVFAWHELPVAAPGIGSRQVADGSTIGGEQPSAYPPKPGPGDRVAVLSPSAGLPERFPRPFGLGLARLRDEFGLAGLGIVGYHGGSVMVEFGRPVKMHPVTAASLRAALFTRGDYELAPVAAYGEENRDWADPAAFEAEPPMRGSHSSSDRS